MIEKKTDIAGLLSNHCHIDQLLVGSDGGARDRVFAAVGETLVNLGYVLINRQDLEKSENKLMSTENVSILDVGGK